MTAYLKLLTVVEPTAAPTAVPTSAPILEDSTYKVLQNGSTGNQVLALQQALAELGYLTSTPDGTYSTTTTQAVIALQKMNSLPMNGIADANLQALISTVSLRIPPARRFPSRRFPPSPASPSACMTRACSSLPCRRG